MSSVFIWKYELPSGTRFALEMPRGARVLDVQTQRGTPVIWAVVDTNQEVEARSFRIFGTGNPLPPVLGDARGFVGTFQTGVLVWHLFEVTS